ncbi:HNH endonuclease signature motif containing protein [Mycolicibacterium chlorophenolicum]|uniref:HNH endonuclease n=1 Tax=Mycolicibacterium chlorophenolicum TaxID=37916 RepID=A0A0J6VIK9_9MYCO|nr:HNH endonuclease signature motif containing protein [Mycolicibacterium chlorophenolicum]KMO70084.1 HNH endonuclease [Mycolicibacterium chlorophenolicum]
MPFASTTIRSRRRAEVRRRDGDGPCALQITADCQAVGGEIDYDAKAPHPRSFQVDHIVSTVEAQILGWSQTEADALDNLQAACSQCNREKSTGFKLAAPGRETYLNPRFAC